MGGRGRGARTPAGVPGAVVIAVFAAAIAVLAVVRPLFLLLARTVLAGGGGLGRDGAQGHQTSGDGAIVAAGSVVTRDVEAGALALVRPEQVSKPGWAARFREQMRARKAAKKAK